MLNNKKYLVCNLKAFKNKEENLNYEKNLNQIKINSNIVIPIYNLLDKILSHKNEILPNYEEIYR